MRPLSGRHAVGGFKITTLGRGGFASRVLRVRHERRTSLTASLGCWHAYPVGVSAALTLAPGSSPWRLQSAHGGTPAYVTDGDGRAGMRRARSFWREGGLPDFPAEGMQIDCSASGRSGPEDADSRRDADQSRRRRSARGPPPKPPGRDASRKPSVLGSRRLEEAL